MAPIATRYLFKPGKYDLDVQVGFYMQVLGLGQSPDDVAITGAVRSKARWMANNNATCNFWRCVENLSVTPTQDQNINIWAVSQATALRRVHVKGATESLGRRLVQRRLHRRLQDRRPGELGLAAAMVFAERGVGQLEGRKLEHGVCRRRQSAGGPMAGTAVHRDRARRR